MKSSAFSVLIFVCGLLIGSMGFWLAQELFAPVSGPVLPVSSSSSTAVFTPTSVSTSTTPTQNVCDPDPFQITEPMADAEVVFPLMIKGSVENQKNTSCRWTMFEGQAGTVELLDRDGKSYGKVPLMTIGDWMTDERVDFSATIPGVAQLPTNFILKFEADDPSGMGKARVMTMSIVRASACTMKPDTGPCKASITRFYFNKLTQTCQSFTWGGCRGSVPFENLKACERTCLAK